MDVVAAKKWFICAPNAVYCFLRRWNVKYDSDAKYKSLSLIILCFYFSSLWINLELFIVLNFHFQKTTPTKISSTLRWLNLSTGCDKTWKLNTMPQVRWYSHVTWPKSWADPDILITLNKHNTHTYTHISYCTILYMRRLCKLIHLVATFSARVMTFHVLKYPLVGVMFRCR